MKEDEKKRLAIVDFLNAVSADLALPEKYRLQAAALTFDFTDPKANPFAPPIQLRIEGDKVVGRANFGPTFEGAVGTVHGGFVAATFDQVLYMAQSVTGIPSKDSKLALVHNQFELCRLPSLDMHCLRSVTRAEQSVCSFWYFEFNITRPIGYPRRYNRVIGRI